MTGNRHIYMHNFNIHLCVCGKRQYAKGKSFWWGFSFVFTPSHGKFLRVSHISAQSNKQQLTLVDGMAFSAFLMCKIVHVSARIMAHWHLKYFHFTTFYHRIPNTILYVQCVSLADGKSILIISKRNSSNGFIASFACMTLFRNILIPTNFHLVAMLCDVMVISIEYLCDEPSPPPLHPLPPPPPSVTSQRTNVFLWW